MVQWTSVAAVAIGGAIGAVARYGLTKSLQPAAPAASFPFGTFTANLIGCLLIGFCFIWLDQRGSDAMRDFVRAGLLGGLTTFSTYCLECITLLQSGHHTLAMTYLLASVAGGLLAAMAGIMLAKSLFPIT